MLPTKEPVLSEVASLAIECSDCGHSRWRSPQSLYRHGFRPQTPLREIGTKLYCSRCRDDGLPGKRIVMQAAFISERSRLSAEAAVMARSRRAHDGG